MRRGASNEFDLGQDAGTILPATESPISSTIHVTGALAWPSGPRSATPKQEQRQNAELQALRRSGEPDLGPVDGAGDEESWMLYEVTARLRKLFGKARNGHGLHAPFRVTIRHGHTVQTFQSLELAIEAAESLGPDHFVSDRHGLQIWDPQRKLLRSQE
jgi:hypothetical protein